MSHCHHGLDRDICTLCEEERAADRRLDRIRALEAEVARLNANLTAHREKYDRIKEQLRQKQRVEDAARAFAAKFIGPACDCDDPICIEERNLLAALQNALAGKEG